MMYYYQEVGISSPPSSHLWQPHHTFCDVAASINLTSAVNVVHDILDYRDPIVNGSLESTNHMRIINSHLSCCFCCLFDVKNWNLKLLRSCVRNFLRQLLIPATPARRTASVKWSAGNHKLAGTRFISALWLRLEPPFKSGLCSVHLRLERCGLVVSSRVLWLLEGPFKPFFHVCFK